MTNKYEFIGNYIIRGKIRCLTGLHIGGNKEKLEIGGVDSPVIRNPQTKFPYIPGTSLKGKMRSLLEFSTGAVAQPHKGIEGNVSDAEEIVRIFGIGADDEKTDSSSSSGPTRLTVRDCNPDKATQERWKDLDSELLYTEYKPENTINRLTSAANPRFIERVVAGSEFNFEMIYGVYDMGETNTNEASQNDLKNILLGLRLLENSAIGQAGSRGYGKIEFKMIDPIFLKIDDYKNNTSKYQSAFVSIADNTKLKDLRSITLPYPISEDTA
jgi:CRISPR-associated protein Csm3